MAKLFLTGASGYIGGEALYALVKSHPEYYIRALVRDAVKGHAISSAFPSVQVVEGNLDDASILAAEVSRADVVLHLAATGHLASVQAIHETLKSRPKDQGEAHWVQISGATALAAGELADKSRVPGSASDVVFDDMDGIAKIREVIQKHPSRAVDNYMLSVAADTVQVNTALLLGPMIYGQGRGPVNQRSIQIPALIKATLQTGRGVQVGKGLSRWGNVHVEDVGSLVVRLVERAMEGNCTSEAWNLNGVYLLGVGEETFGAISRSVASTTAQKGLIPKGEEVDELLGEKAETVLPHGTILFGTNARGNAGRARQVLGWVPRHENGLEAEIPRVVDAEAKALGMLD